MIVSSRRFCAPWRPAPIVSLGICWHKELGQPESRLRGILVGLQRLLNIDGYQVVAVDEATGTVELNRTLLDRQFQIV